MWNNKKQQKSCFLYVKLTNLLSFSTRFPKSVPTYRRQVVNPRHRTPQGQSVAKPGNQLYAIFLLIHCLFVLQITESHQTDGVVPLGRLPRLRGHIADFYDRRYLSYFAITGRKNDTKENFLMGSRSIAILPVSLSLFLTWVTTPIWQLMRRFYLWYFG